MAAKAKARARAGELPGEAFEKGLDVSEIHQVWDSDSDIRNRLRGGMGLLHPKTGLIATTRHAV